MGGCNKGRVQTLRLTDQARTYVHLWDDVYMTQGPKCILGSTSGPFVVCRYVRGEEAEVTSSSKTLPRLKFNPGVSVLRGKKARLRHPALPSAAKQASVGGKMQIYLRRLRFEKSWISTHK